MESSRYQPPVRHSLSDEELAARVAEATESQSGVESVMNLLVTQEALRAQEDRELAAWVLQMESEGSEDARAALAKFRGVSYTPAPAVEPEVVAHLEPETPQSIEVEPEPEVPPFTWFTKVDEVESEVIEPEIVEEVVIDEVVVVEELTVPEPVHIEGEETVDEFEQLLVRAAAEEELTALEDSTKVSKPVTAPSNLLVPTDENRDRKPVSQFATWLGLSATVIPVLLAWTLLQFKIEFNAVVLDLGFGYLIAGTLISLAALAGKRSGLSTATVSRAVFGVWGNAVPLTFVFIGRILVTALAAAAFAFVMNGFDSRVPLFATVLAKPLGIQITTGLVVELVLLAFAFGLALIRGTIGRIAQLVTSLLAFGFFAEGLVGLSTTINTPHSVDVKYGFISSASFGAIALVALVPTVLFVSLAPNVAKSIPMKHKGMKVFGYVYSASALLPFLVAALTAAWFGSAGQMNRTIFGWFGYVPSFTVIDARDMLLTQPIWVRGAVGTGITLGVLYIVAMSLRTAALDLMSLVRWGSKSLALVVSFLLTTGFLVLFAQQKERDLQNYLVNLLVLVGILTVTWIGMFVADVALRRIAYHELSLTRSYGFYGKVNVLSLAIWLIMTVFGLLVVPVDLLGFGFTGALGSSFGIGLTITSQALGLVLILALSGVLTLAIRIPQIRKQEREVEAVESRREALNDIFVSQE